MSSRITIKDCHDFALSRGGKCLSDIYVNGKILMEWQCGFLHKFPSNFHNIKGTKEWCPECRKISKSTKKTKQHRLDINQMYQFAIKNGGKCLSSSYVNEDILLKWCCECGEIWECSYRNMRKRKYWCLNCGDPNKIHIKFTIEQMHQFAIERGGLCLSIVYINCTSKLIWLCPVCNYTWDESYANMQDNKYWCAKCSGKERREKLTIDDAHIAAKNKGGKCLSTVYVNCNEYLEFECELKHKWKTTLNSIRNGGDKGTGTWCDQCGKRKKLTLELAQQIAEERKGKCLSTEYINCETDLIWMCESKHVWPATLTNVKNHDSWCKICKGMDKWTIEELSIIAINNGGSLLSTEYVNRDCFLEWKCSKQHAWSAPTSSIVAGCWCSICKESQGERLVRQWLIESNLEFISQIAFIGSMKTYDFYVESTNWLIEFDGQQHFKDTGFFSGRSFEEQQDSDREKTIMAYEQDIPLLRIHYNDLKNIYNFLQVVLKPSASCIIYSRKQEYEYLNIPLHFRTFTFEIEFVNDKSMIIDKFIKGHRYSKPHLRTKEYYDLFIDDQPLTNIISNNIVEISANNKLTVIKPILRLNVHHI